MNQTQTLSTEFVQHTKAMTFLAIDERSGYMVVGPASIIYLQSNKHVISAYMDEPVRRSSRRAKLLANPEKSAALAKARHRLSQAVDENSKFSLTKLRLQAGLSQAMLASLIGSQQPAIARLEKGEIDPGVSTLTKLATALGVSAEVVLRAIIATKESLQQQ